MALLVSLAKYKEAIGETDAANDSKHTEAIEDASAAVLNYTDRDFASPLVTEDRTYRYDGSGIVEIDDAETINSVTWGTAVLASDRYIARKEGPPTVVVYSYLELPPFTLSTGEMGFERNEDVYLTQSIARREVSVTVNAVWGWPTVPDDVQRAVIWTAAGMESSSGSIGAGLSSKSVAEVAEAYINQEQAENTEPLPARAKALLDPYKRYFLPS